MMPNSYIICGTPRSGSTLLCRLLAATGMAGKPNSFFRAPSIDDWADDWGLPPRHEMTEADFAEVYLKAAIAEGENGTGIFGLRLMHENLADAMAMIDRVHPGLGSDPTRFEAAFGPVLYIHLSRGDKVAQAVSLVKAEQTGLWHRAADGSELERLAPPADPAYDFDRIDGHVTALEGHDAGWRRWFDAHDISPVRITYERLSADPGVVLAQLLDHLGRDAANALQAEPDVTKLADTISDAWIARYRVEKASAG